MLLADPGAWGARALRRGVGTRPVLLHDAAAAVHQRLVVVRPDAEAADTGPRAPAAIHPDGRLRRRRQADQHQDSGSRQQSWDQEVPCQVSAHCQVGVAGPR